MAHAYTPGLRVRTLQRVERERRLPLPGKVLVQQGERVAADTVIARTELPGDVTTLAVANQLGIDNADLPEMMLVGEGGAVSRDQVLARTAGLFGLFKSEVRSPIDGVVESVSKVTGQVLLRGRPKPIAVDAYVSGQVARLLPGEGAVVAAEGAFVQGIFGIGGETRGPIRVVAGSPGEELDPGRLDATMAGSVVVGGSFAGLAAIRRAIELRAAALVVGGVAYASFTELLGRPIGVAVTGGEAIGITLVVTEGFGRIPMARRTFALLSASAGREAAVNGATQIRAGVIRPEILIPSPPDPGRAVPGEPEPRGLEVGSEVRVIREPWFGRLGRVASLPAEPRVLETETRARVAIVRLDDAAEVVVPRSNLERIEE